ncbi:MAG: uridine diphosphate-N-acetylglucosamine-binding protein YvcK [Solobacterium sp.]|nr:uridine diphosphate-N-acetylglucosamine-binding protein YvcK [Solobacterium sp.]
MTVQNKKIVVIGGGHGQSAICRGIKFIEDVDISAIVTVADDGGSTGRLRRQFHIPAMGDIRNVMIALAGSETVLSNLMDYRFDDPDGSEEDVHGHNLGNLILTALTQQSGSFLEAVRTIEQVLNVRGKIIPATTQVITLLALMEDDVIVKGEANIPTVSNRIRKVFYEEPVKASREAVDAILNADLIIYGIGSVFTSILPNVIIPELTEALQQTEARKVYFCNAMTQVGETDGFDVEAHVAALNRHGAPVDEVIVADNEVPEYILERYRKEGSSEVRLSKDRHDYKVVKMDLLNFDGNLVRHDSMKIKKAVEYLLQELGA